MLPCIQKFALFIIIFVIGIAEWPKFARTVRACVLAEKKKKYVEAARVMGFDTSRIMFCPHFTQLFKSNFSYWHCTDSRSDYDRGISFLFRAWNACEYSLARLFNFKWI